MMKITTDLERFKGYDRSLAECHMANWGIIYLDEYLQPMEIEDISSEGLG